VVRIGSLLRYRRRDIERWLVDQARRPQ